MEVNFIQSRISGFAKLDIRYFIPFFTRRFTQEVSVKYIKLLKYYKVYYNKNTFKCYIKIYLNYTNLYIN
jgi:hypothetical protein